MTCSELPSDVIENMLQFSTVSDVRTCMQVRSQWHDVGCRDRLWRDITLERLAFAGSDKSCDENWKQYFVRTSLTKQHWEQGKPRHFKMQALRGHTKHITGIHLSEDGERIGSASADGSLRLYKYASAEGSKEVGVFKLGGPLECIEAVGDTIYAAGHGMWYQCDVGSGLVKNKTRTEKGAVSMSVDEDNDLVVVGGDEWAAVYDVRSGKNVHVLKGLRGPVTYVKAMFDKRYSITAGTASKVAVYDIRSSDAAAHEYDAPYPADITAVKWSYTTDDIVIGHSDGNTCIFSSKMGVVDANLPQLTGAVACVERSETHAVVGTKKGELLLVNYFGKGDTTIHRQQTLNEHAKRVNDVKLKNSRLVTGSADGTAQVFSVGRVGKKLFSVLGGSLQPNARNPPHPRKPFVSSIDFDDEKVLLSWNAVLRVYNFTLKAKEAAADCGEVEE
eukprot:TRINITY_DN4883_c0_g2_i1.p1 TRINITY_DN4883_c0_g2~~TRINITY_DN4883_c0_g2_i1.p1  ORF type:complete len:446 (+),score=125.08 TRINITY_DN4883_c0_g2_i1:442-1779(+)